MKTHLINWKNFLLLFIVIFILYNFLWFLIDNETRREFVDNGFQPVVVLIDAITCLIFTALSLVYSYAIYRVMPSMHGPYRRMLVNACVLFLLNNLTAILIVNVFDYFDDTINESLHVKGVYIYAMISTFVSSIYSNSMYMDSYIKASRELSAAIEKVKKAEKASETSAGIRELIDAVQHGGYRYRERFLLPYRDGYNAVSVNDINHVYTEDRVTKIALNNGTSVTISLSMDEVERQLNPDQFFRANRQYIVSIDHILYIGKYFGGKLLLHLKGYEKVEIVVSKERASLLKQWLDR